MRALVARVSRLWGAILRYAQGIQPSPGPGATDPTEPTAERELIARVKLTVDLPWPDDRALDDREADAREEDVLAALRRRLFELQTRLDRETAFRLGPGFSVGEPALYRGSIGIDIPILVAAGVVIQYGAFRSGIDHLRRDFAQIVGREIRRDDQFGYTIVDTEVVLGERFHPVASAAAPAEDSGAPVAAWLIGGLAFVTAILTAIGADAANVERVRVNFPNAFTFAILVVILAVVLGVLYPVMDPGLGRRLLVVLGVFLLASAITALTYMTTSSLSAKSRPRMAATLERAATGDKVTGSVTAAGLKSEEHIAVRVIGISTRERLSDQHVGHARPHEAATDRQVVYSSRTGPDSVGATKVEFTVPVGTGLYERFDVESELVSKDEDPAALPRKGATALNVCDRNTRQFSCMSLTVPPASRRPQLAARWKLPPGRPPVLALSARMTGLSSDDRLLLSVRRVRGESLGGRIYAASWAPDPAGAVSEMVELSIAPSRRPVCVLLRTREAGLSAGSEKAEGFGPCRPRSRGVAVYARPPARAPVGG